MWRATESQAGASAHMGCPLASRREAFYLAEAGYATPPDVHRWLLNDLGYWTTFAGRFRMMDPMSISASCDRHA